MLALVALVAGCGGGKFRTYNGPEVTRIVVFKGERKMHLLHGTKALKTYDIRLGGNPVGDKQFEGDLKTPEGVYHINRRNPRSTYHLSLGISYPNDNDRAEAEAMGKEPGGDIMVHGAHPRDKRRDGDWTAGCIAVSDREIEEIYSMVKVGTPIIILP